MKRLRIPLVAVLVGALLLGLPSAANAQIPVHDYISWILSLIQRYQQIENQAEQLRRQARQIEIAAKTIERFGRSGDWASLQALFTNLDVLFNSTENLGYLYSRLGTTWDDTFPGYHPPFTSWPVDQQRRASRTFSTLRQTTLALHQIAELNAWSDITLGVLRDRSEQADTPQKQLEVHSMLLDFQATEISRTMQASLLAANAVTVLGAEQLQRSATADQARNAWIERNDPTPLSELEAQRGYTGVPHAWPWTIHF